MRNKVKRTIRKVDALAGSGKTFAMCDYVDVNAELGQKYLIVQPSRTLINQTAAVLRSKGHGYPVSAIHGGNTDHVMRDIEQATRAMGEKQGGVIIVSHAAFMMSNLFIHNQPEWHVIMDEIVQADHCFERNLPVNHDFVTKAITTAAYSAEYARVIPVDHLYLDAMARNRKGDEINQMFSDLAYRLISPHWDSFTLDSQYQRLIAKDDGVSRFQVFSVLSPTLFDGFRSVTVMGACFTQSMMYQLWTARGVEFVSHRAIEGRVRYTSHQNDHLLSILYAGDEAWSKNFRDKLVTDPDGSVQRVFAKVVDEIKREFATDQFVWMGNTDCPADLFDNGIRLPNSPHGLNSFQGFHNCVVVSALNPPPAHFKFLSTLGVDGDSVRDAYYHQACYQAFLRTSQRNPADKTPKKLVVMDRGTAEWMQSMFPRATVGKLGSGVTVQKGKPGRPKKHASRAERDALYRARQKAKKLVALDAANDGAVPGMSVFSSIYDTTAAVVFTFDDIDQCVADLRATWENNTAAKHDNILLSPAVFDPSKGETSRGTENVVALSALWLDNDGGDLGYEEFAKLFPRLRMVAMNTASTRPGNPRYRIFIPTLKRMPVDVHGDILRMIEQALNRTGYWSDKQAAERPGRKTHGFDVSKFAPGSLFYVPSQAEQPGGISFFEEYRDGIRAVLDPAEWIKHSTLIERAPDDPMPVLPVRSEIVVSGADEVQSRIDRAIEKYLTTPAGSGHDGFMGLGRSLQRAGLDLGTIRLELTRAAAMRSRSRGEISGVMKTLTKPLNR
jgi:hypothetical protein